MRLAHTVSWALFALLGAATIALSLGSAAAGYLDPGGDLIAGKYTPGEVADGDAEIASALSARRGTAAAFGLSYGILLLGVALGPYRKRRQVRGAFLLLLLATVANAVVILLRVPLLGANFGLGAATVPLLVVAVAAVAGIRAKNLSRAEDS